MFDHHGGVLVLTWVLKHKEHTGAHEDLDKNVQTCNWQRLRTCGLIDRTIFLEVVALLERLSFSDLGVLGFLQQTRLNLLGECLMGILSVEVPSSY